MSPIWWTTTELRELRKGGELTMLAGRIGRTQSAVYNAAKKYGIDVPRADHPLYWGEAVKSRALRLRSAGWPVSRISRATGVPFGTVRRWIYDTTRRTPAVPAGSESLGGVHRATVENDAGTRGRNGETQVVADSRTGTESGDCQVKAGD